MGRKSTAPLGKPARPYSQISDGKKVKVKGQANVPTKRQKTDMASLAASAVGGAFGKPILMLAKSLSKPMLEKALQPLTRSKTQPSRKAIKEQLTKVKKPEGKRNLPSKTRPVPARGTSGRPTKTPANASGRNLSTSTNKSVAPRPRPKPNMKTVGSGKVSPRGTSGRPAATPANASGLRSLAAKQTVKPQIALAGLDTKKPSKKKNDPVGSGQTPATGYVKSKRKPKPNNNRAEELNAASGVTSGKKSSKFKDEGGKYKQYEWAKKLDPSDPRFQSGYMTQKGYDSEDMEAAKKGGQIKKLTKTKKVVKKKPASKKGFSGRGTGASLRGF